MTISFLSWYLKYLKCYSSHDFADAAQGSFCAEHKLGTPNFLWEILMSISLIRILLYFLLIAWVFYLWHEFAFDLYCHNVSSYILLHSYRTAHFTERRGLTTHSSFTFSSCAHQRWKHSAVGFFWRCISCDSHNSAHCQGNCLDNIKHIYQKW